MHAHTHTHTLTTRFTGTVHYFEYLMKACAGMAIVDLLVHYTVTVHSLDKIYSVLCMLCFLRVVNLLSFFVPPSGSLLATRILFQYPVPILQWLYNVSTHTHALFELFETCISMPPSIIITAAPKVSISHAHVFGPVLVGRPL